MAVFFVLPWRRSVEYRNAPFEFRVADKTAGIVEARVNQLLVVDDYQSVFSDGFWDRAIAKAAGKMPKVLVDHEGRRAGRVTETRQVREGNKVFQHATLQYNLRGQYGAEAFADVLDGTDDEFSNGFLTEKQHIETRDGVRVVIKDEPKGWYEVSQVMSGASPGTGPIAVRDVSGILTVTSGQVPTLQRRDAPEGSYEDLSQDLRQVIEEWLGGNWQDWEHGRYFYINHTMPDYVVIEIAGLPGSQDSTTFLKFPYLLGPDGEPLLAGVPQEVTPMYVPVNDTARGRTALTIASSALALDTRIGARNAVADQKRIQSMHDLTAQLGAQCQADNGSDTGSGADDTKRSLITRAYRLRLDAAALT